MPHAAAQHGCAGEGALENLPPASLATWGEGLTPALLPAAAAGEIVTPPAPAPHEPELIHFRLSGLGKDPVAVKWIWDNGREQQTLGRAYKPADTPDGAQVQEIAVTPGVPFTVAALTSTTPPRIALYSGMCAPETFATEPPVWELSFHGGATLHGTLRDGAGQPVRLVTQLSLLPMMTHVRCRRWRNARWPCSRWCSGETAPSLPPFSFPVFIAC